MVTLRSATGAQAGVLVAAATTGVLIATTAGTGAATRVRYQTTPVTRATVTDQVSATGTVTANATVDLGFGFGTTDSVVTSVRVRVGEHVHRGQLLATVDDSGAQAQLAAARAALTAAESLAAAATTAAGVATTPEPATPSTAPATQTTASGCRTSAQPKARPTPRPTRKAATPSASPSRDATTPSASPTATASAPGPTSTTGTQPAPSPTTTHGASTSQRSPTRTSPPSPRRATTCRAGSTPSGPRPGTRTLSTNAATAPGGARATGVGELGGSGGSGSSVTAAQQQVSAAQAAVAAARIVAPQPGVITAVNLVVGTLPGTPAVELRSTALAVQVPVQEQDAPYVRPGQTAQISYTALGVTGTGTVGNAPLEPSTPTSTGASGPSSGLAGLLGLAGPTTAVVTYPVNVTISNPPPGLLPGMSALATWTAATRSNVLAVPTGAIHSSGVTDDVQLLVNGTPQTRVVTLGLSTSSMTEVTSGLEPGDRVITGEAA